MPKTRSAEPPWIFRTYAGHSTAEDSNRLYRANLAKGQTGLSIAFDLPTQTGYDSDHPLASGEVGRVGVPVSHIEDMRILMRGLALSQMNTSMTINATAAWLLALYIAVADEQGAERRSLKGTTQNDVIKEYLSRGTYIFPPAPSLKITSDMIAFCAREMPKWNPVNVCSYHLQEAGATPIEELAFALAAAIAILDTVKGSGQVEASVFPQVVGRISFFVNAGMKFITEICKMRAFAELWDEICHQRYGIEEAQYRRFRYGVQVNSLGLTEQQPENNAYRILIEMLGVVLSKATRARAVQLPAWNEALGLPRPWDQQWSLRMQQILAFETDLLEFGDIFEGSSEIARKSEELKQSAKAELQRILDMGGAVRAVEQGYMKRRLVQSNSQRIRAIESGEQVVIGVNAYAESEPSPFGIGGAVVSVGDNIQYERSQELKVWRSKRDNQLVADELKKLKSAAAQGQNIMEASIGCAKAGATSGEWAEALRDIFGEYRAPTGVLLNVEGAPELKLDALREAVEKISGKLGTRVRLVIGKPGLDGHSNAAEQIAERAARCGIVVRYDGIRQTPAQIAQSALESKAHIIGLSILSGSHVPLVREIMKHLRELGLGKLPVVVGGIVPPDDVHILKQLGVKKIYGPRDFEIDHLIDDMIKIVDEQSEDSAPSRKIPEFGEG